MTDTTTAEIHRSIALDEQKRHFVFGDINGRYETFKQLLELIGYDASTDVIYSVGNMIGRGPDSVSVVEFFQQEHCHAILGNLEQMLADQAAWGEHWLKPWAGGEAISHSLNVHGYEKPWLTDICQELPVCLDVGSSTQAAAFRLVHAECPLNWNEAQLMWYFSSTSRGEIGNGQLVWGGQGVHDVQEWHQSDDKTKLYVADDRSERAVFCGFMSLQDVVSGFNMSWINTFAGHKLTCVDPINSKIYQQAIATGDELV